MDEDLELLPPQELSDLKRIYGGILTADTPGLTDLQSRLVKLASDNPDKFTSRLEKLQLAHDEKARAIAERRAAEITARAAGLGDVIDDADLAIAELIDKLVADFDPAAEARRFEQERQSRQPRL